MFGCLTQLHDMRLVGLAVLVCVLAAITAVTMLSRADATARQGRLLWSAGAAFAFGSGVWATHFISMLAFRSAIPIGFELRLTVWSLAIALLGSLAGMLLIASARGHRGRRVLGGVVLGATIGAMHYAGMAALTFAGLLRYQPPVVALSLAAGIAFAAAAAWTHDARRRWLTVPLLTLAVAGAHFIGMSATTLMPLAIAAKPGYTLAPGPFALAVAAWSLLILVLSFAGALVDQHMATRLSAEAGRLRLFADGTFEGIFFHRDGRVTDANLALGELLGESPANLVGLPVTDLFPPDLRQRAAAFCAGDGGTPDEVELQTADERRIPVELLGRSTDRNTGMVAIRDVSERKVAEQRILRLAQFDSLTGLANRMLFLDRLRQSLALAERADTGLALLCIDLDRFKEVNDTLGHPSGDELLTQVGLRLSAVVREMDTVARLGGDEFAILQPLAAQPQAASALAQRVLDALSAPFMLHGQEATIGASIGIALAPRDGITSPALLGSADIALYRAKQAGRGTFCLFEHNMHTRIQERRELEHDLRQALAEGSLDLHYQPICNALNQRIVGYEALLRWTHPQRGVVTPAEMIPVAEETGLIGPIGEWVLRTACNEAARWPEPLFVAVNLSPRQFRQRDLPAMIGGILRQSGLPAHRLELEVTESSMIENTDRALVVLNAIRMLGARLALDDFGTGYASLGYLRQFPFDKVKIDRSFVGPIGRDTDACAILGSIVALAHSLRLTVTAEGVETPEQLAMLRAQRCDEVQGYLLGRPVPLAAPALQTATA